VIRNANQYHIDTSEIVLSGESAGGHLSLITGMLPLSAGLDRECAGTEELKVAAIVNLCGITDVEDLIDGPNVRPWATSWLGGLPNREELARRVSPINYVRLGLPPIVTLHGDDDPEVPYSHAVRLHEALSKAGVPNQLLTISKGGHCGFSRDQTIEAYDAVEKFLAKFGLRRHEIGPSRK
jgi:acetyl esterase/lipase